MFLRCPGGRLFSRREQKICLPSLDILFNAGNETIAAGDFNAKHHQWNSRVINAKGRQLLRWISAHQCRVSAPRSPTHFSYNNEGDILDIAVHNLQSVLTARTINALESDHFPVIFHHGRRPVLLPERIIKDYSNADWDVFRQEVTAGIQYNIKPAALRNAEEIEDTVSCLTTIVSKAIDKSVPSKTVKAWNHLALPPEITAAIRKKNRLRRRYQRSRDAEDKALANAARHLVRSLITDFRQQSWDRKIASLDLENGSFWRMAKALRNENAEEAPLRTPTGLISSPKDKAEAMADYLEDIFSPSPPAVGIPNPLRERVAKPQWEQPGEQPPPPPDDSRPKVTTAAILRAVKRTKARKAPGPDGVTNAALKAMPKSMAIVLLMIFQACLSIGYFPALWKRARVICLPKPGKPPTLRENFRPISLLNTMGKLFEHVILESLRETTDALNILPPHQFGFRSEHSTTHQVARLLNFVVEGFNRNCHTVGAFFDISKAFDKVWHEGLLWKLHCFGYQRWLLRIIASWLNHREFYVAWGTATSTSRRIRAGVPQGSLLSPTLFNVFTSDIPGDLGTNMMAALYADDAALLARSANQQMAVTYLQRATDQLVDWYAKWRFGVNERKTQAIVFSRGRKEPGELLVGCTEVLWQEAVEYLGVHLDRRLTMKYHARRKAAIVGVRRHQISSMLGNVNLPQHSRLHLHKAIIRPIITYAAPAWFGVASKSAQHILAVAERKSLRVALGLGWTPHNDALWPLARMEPLEESLRSQTQTFFQEVAESKFPELRRIAEFPVRPLEKYKRPCAGTGHTEDLPPKDHKNTVP